MRNIAEISNSEDEQKRCMGDSWKNNLRVACPGIIQGFDEKEQTVTVQLALREEITGYDYNKQWMDIPVPIKQGDECLVVFGDMCIDGWWQHGGIQNQIEKRRHDLSDGFAILGTWSQPRVIKDYSTDSCQLRNETGNSIIELKNNEINLISNKVKINGIDITPIEGD